MSETPSHDRRCQPDRRKSATSPLSIYAALGSRYRHRRHDDHSHAPYVDLYSVRSLSLILAVLVLSVVDGFFTLHLLKLGAREVNPLMRLALGHGPLFFLLTKYTLTGAALVLLLIHKEFCLLGGRLRPKYLLVLFLVLYFALVIYELVLICHIVPAAA